MAFDRLDTNTIVTLHSSGSSRSLVHGRSNIHTLQISAWGLQRSAKHREKTMFMHIYMWYIRILTKEVGDRILNFFEVNILSQLAVVI